MKATIGLIWLVGCAGGDDLQRALTGTHEDPPTEVAAPDGGARLDGARPDLELRDAAPRDARLADEGPLDAAADAARPRPDQGPPPDAALPPDAAVGPCDDRVGRRCEVGVGECRRRGELVCEPDGLACSAVPGVAGPEGCNGLDDDCDGLTDEGVANACGACGPVPDEVCNGLDDNCNGVFDEGVANVCGGCGPVPGERCDGIDQDCDGRVDEDACRAWVLLPGADRWVAPFGLNDLPPQEVDAAATVFTDVPEIWLFIGDRIYIYRFGEDRIVADVPLAILPGVTPPVETAEVVPLWWRLRNEPNATRSSLVVSQGDQYRALDLDPFARDGRGVEEGDLEMSWLGDPLAPNPPLALRAAVLDLRNARGFWRGRPREACPNGGIELGPTYVLLNEDRLYIQDVGVCFRFVREEDEVDWPGFRLPGSPDPSRITAWTHIEDEDPAFNTEVVFLR